MLLVLIVGLWMSPAAEAQAPELSTYESKAYKIHTNLTRAEALEYGVHMDLIYKEYAKRFSVLRGRSRGKQNLYLLRNRQDYIEALVALGLPRDIASSSGGMFFWGPNREGLATWIEDLTRDQVFSTLQHEGFHQFAHAKMGDQLPLWVNEGLAEYFGAAIVVDGDVRLGVVDGDRVEKIRGALESNEALSFRELLGIDSRQWQQNMTSRSAKGSLQYDQSWATVHFLIHGDRGKYQKAFSEYLVLISRGRTHDQAFGQTFGSDTRPFEKRWMKFIDEVEPDAYSTALKRLQFLGSGLEFLQTNDVSAPADTEALREALQSRQYKVTWLTESGTKVTDSADDTLYAYLDRKDNEHAFEIIPAEEGSDLPPRIAATQLRPVATLTWVRDEDGNLRSQIEYGRLRRR
ncbi:MAG: DUF1570 domain-containing protein [Planctomycetota bacterium]